MSTLEQRVEYLEKLVHELRSGTSQKEELEVKQWEPVGGDWFVYSEGEVSDEPSTDGCRLFGMERSTEEQAEKARDKMRVFNRLLAYVDEHCPDFEYDADEANYHIDYNYNSGRYEYDWDGTYKRVGAVHMSQDVAEELCRKLNSGEVAL